LDVYYTPARFCAYANGDDYDDDQGDDDDDDDDDDDAGETN